MSPDQLPQLIHAINQRIDEHHALLLDRLRDVEDSLRSMHAMLERRLDAHEDYHRHNEHRFGLLRLAQRHPARMAALAFVTGGVLLGPAPDSLHSLATVAGSLLRQFIGLPG